MNTLCSKLGDRSFNFGLKGLDMSPAGQINLYQAIEQTDAIFALAGFSPTAQRRAISDAVLAQRVTYDQVARELSEFILLHQSSDGFVESRQWR